MSNRLRERLILFDFMCSLFGLDSLDEFREILRPLEEGFGEDCHSNYYYVLRGLLGLSISEDKIAQYDLNIKEYVDRMNKGRFNPITLRYFQYLAVLFTEIYLDMYFTNKEKLLESLDKYVDLRNKGVSLTDKRYFLGFQPEHLKKLAYWMATGSGKTLIMHINLWQFLRYNDIELDNVFLITPNEAMTRQHIGEMRMSGIKAYEFVGITQTLLSYNQQEVKVIDIHKLRKERGEKTVAVESLEGHNLVFIDEGHMGASGEVWMKARETVIGDGFSFEYSATFGQAFSGSQDSALLEEYSKAIIVNYSYRYFYEDGYGKDYDILNLPEDQNIEMLQDIMFGNLLSFYEQTKYYEEKSDLVQEFNVRKPLWIFVGRKVNAVYTRDGKKRSDLTTILAFLQKFLKNEDNWSVNKTRDFLKFGATIQDAEGEDIFQGKFDYVRTLKKTPEQLYGEILKHVFRTNRLSALYILLTSNHQKAK